MLLYWEQYNNRIRETVDWNFERQEIHFPKKKERATCVSIYKNKEDEYQIKLSYFIGIDWIPNTSRTIYVAPKLNTKFKEDGTPDYDIKIEDIQQTDYLKMLFAALKHPEIAKYTDDLFDIKWDAPQIEITQQQDLLTPLLVVQFLRLVQEIVRKGLKKSYYRVEQNLNSKVKGKILVGKTIKQNLLKNKPLNTFCTFDEFGVNGLENRLLNKALVFVRRYLPTLKIPNSEEYTTQVFNYIMPAFEMVSEEVSLNDIKHTKTNVFYKEYKEGIRLAKLILKRFGYNITNTDQKSIIKTPPFWIDMSKLFELYVLGLLKDRYGNEVKFQFQSNYGKLDYLLMTQKTVVDAKYKTYYKQAFSTLGEDHKKAIASDIRQVSGYARDTKVLAKLRITEVEQLSYVPKCLIIYPDQSIEVKEAKIIDSSEVPIKEFVNFYKMPVKLPLLKTLKP